ncbi:unnamed protein product [Rhizophagus irregularis]|nr:unnamed protein product [Rhizophagus irregularis]
MLRKKNKKHFTANHMMIFISLRALMILPNQVVIFIIITMKTMKHHSYIDDEDEVHNNPNLHSEEQDELEIPES